MYQAVEAALQLRGQAGANQVSVITSSAEREASIEFGKAAVVPLKGPPSKDTGIGPV